MKLFDRFSKKQVSGNSAAQPAGDRNFVDDLVSYFSSQPEVTAAYFGFAYNTTDRGYHLFLAVDHTGDAASIQRLTWTIKSTYMNDTRIQYACRTTNKDLLEYISQHNPPFYHKDNTALLQQKVMKQWFDVKQYKQELIDTLNKCEVLTLVHKFEKQDEHLTFATYVRDSGEFIALFGNRDMITKSGMSEIPADKAVIRMRFDAIAGMINRGQFFVLNPGTPFEVELRV